MAEGSSLATFLGSSGAIGALVGVGSLVASWIRDHDATENYRKDLAALSARVAFWKTWLEASALAGLSEDELGGIKRTAITELDRICLAMQVITDERSKALVSRKPKPRHIGLVRRALLLYSPPKPSLAFWPLRLFFYFWVAAEIAAVVDDAKTGDFLTWPSLVFSVNIICFRFFIYAVEGW